MSVRAMQTRRNRRQFANPTVTANTYAGDLATPFVGPALKANATVANNTITVLDGIHYKAVVPIESAANDILQQAACAWTDGDSITLNEAVVTLDDLMINEALCRGTIYPTWHGVATSRQNSDLASQEFINYTMGLVAAKAAERNEINIWRSGQGGYAQGFLSNDGAFDATGFAASKLANATPVTISAITNSNAIAQFNAVYNGLIAANDAVLSKTDVGFYVSPKTYALYTQELAGLGAASASLAGQGVNNAGPTGQFNSIGFMGLPVHVCPGMFNDAIVLGAASNLIMATNLTTDLTEAKWIPAYEYDGSDNIKISMRFAYGQVVPIPAEVAVGKTF